MPKTKTRVSEFQTTIGIELGGGTMLSCERSVEPGGWLVLSSPISGRITCSSSAVSCVASERRWAAPNATHQKADRGLRITQAQSTIGEILHLAIQPRLPPRAFPCALLRHSQP